MNISTETGTFVLRVLDMRLLYLLCSLEICMNIFNVYQNLCQEAHMLNSIAINIF
jgi:hypothetical protein